MISAEEFWNQVSKSGECWLWTGALHQHGYGLVRRRKNGRQYRARAHRLAWEFVRGSVPEGLVLHHTCQERRCVNPAHLEAVTPYEHRQIHRMIECANGHPMVPENIYVRPDCGTETCLTCRRISNREHSRRRSEARRTA